MKITRVLIIGLLCIGVASVADARTKRHQRHRHHRHHLRVAPTAPTAPSVPGAPVATMPAGPTTSVGPTRPADPPLPPPPPSGDFTFVETLDVHPDSPENTLSVAKNVFNDPDIIDCFRADGTGTFTNSAGTFTITLVPSDLGPTYDVTWTLAAGQVLEGVYFKGGSQGGNFYSAGELNSGFGNGHTPVTGGSGMFAGLSHLDFFCEPGRSVPDGGSAITLLGLALCGLEGVRRLIRARKG